MKIYVVWQYNKLILVLSIAKILIFLLPVANDKMCQIFMLCILL